MLKPGGRIAFYTIHMADGLSPADYRRTSRAVGTAVTSWRRTQEDLLRAAGFADIATTDVTREYTATARALLEGRSRYEPELRTAWGDVDFEDRQRRSELGVAAIEAGHLRRALLSARRPR